MSEGFSRRQRIRSKADFDRVYRANAYAADDVLVVQVARAAQAESRLGISVSRKVGSAVQRNYWKRLVRESFRRNHRELPRHLEIVVRPRKGAVPSYRAIAASLPRLVRRAVKRLTQQVKP